jgi:hypothetical protein
MSSFRTRVASSWKNLRRQRRRGVHARRNRLPGIERLEARAYLSLTVPAFSSLPNADHTIYLDFDGHVTQDTRWNDYFSNPSIESPAFDEDGDASSFSSTELSRIENVWKRVSEDFVPFQVNVTTVDPGVDALRKSGPSDTAWGMRVVITADTENSGHAGLSYTGSFNLASDTPAFVYTLGEKATAEAVSHELGHSLYLSHDGTSSSPYYSGHGSGDTGWAPIMGSGYAKQVTTWDRGEFHDAANSGETANQRRGPSDLMVITTYNGFGFRSDDHGDTAADASPLQLSGSELGGSGIIETTDDVDVFSFTTNGGQTGLDVSPFRPGPNLDVKAVLYDDAGNLLAVADPSASLDASLRVNLSAGRYHLHVMGTGTGDPTTDSPTGYTDYASLGRYAITGTTGPEAASLPPAVESAVLGSSKIGAYQAGQFLLDVNGNGRWDGWSGGDAAIAFGAVGDTPVIGDWDGDGYDDLGVRRGSWFLLDTNGNRRWDGEDGGDTAFRFGKAKDKPVVGDWNGDGVDDVGLRRGRKFVLDRNGFATPGGVARYRFGKAKDEPIIGDWDGDGDDDLGVRRKNRFLLDRNDNGRLSRRESRRKIRFGSKKWTPVIGDWDGDGKDEIGVHRRGQFLLDYNGNRRWNGKAGGDVVYTFGSRLSRPLVGNWEPGTPLLASVESSANGSSDQPQFLALPYSAAADRVDLVTVLAHEVAHVLGHEHDEGGMLQATLTQGERLAAADHAIDHAFHDCGHHEGLSLDDHAVEFDHPTDPVRPTGFVGVPEMYPLQLASKVVPLRLQAPDLDQGQTDDGYWTLPVDIRPDWNESSDHARDSLHGHEQGALDSVDAFFDHVAIELEVDGMEAR